MAANRPTMSSLGGTKKTTTKKVVLDYQPRHAVPALSQSNANALPFWSRIVVRERRSPCVNDLIRRAIETNRTDARFAYIAPYYAQAKDVAWQYLKHYAAPLLADTPNEIELQG